jgi:hypothetical protein
VPDGDFVQFFRGLLQRPEGADYFPKLRVIEGRIHRIDGPKPLPIETASSTQPLMTYLNPTLAEVEDQEVICAGRLIHWTAAARPVRLAQISGMVSAYKRYMAAADKRGLVDGRGADQCCVIADILHQGRGTWAQIATAVKTPKPFDSLVAIGAPQWAERKATLKRMILANPALKTRKWSRAKAEFV